jgi:putative FmdB family regulatory protein
MITIIFCKHADGSIAAESHRAMPAALGVSNMPIYEYQCEECDCDFEYLVMAGDKPCCPNCNSKKVDKKMSACGFLSKGSGGQTLSRSAGSSCGGCTAGSCSSCSH